MGTPTAGRQDARIHVSEPDFEVLTQGGTLVDQSKNGGITIVEFEKIIRAQLTLLVQAGHCIIIPQPNQHPISIPVALLHPYFELQFIFSFFKSLMLKPLLHIS
jgi:hypothetical protein